MSPEARCERWLRRHGVCRRGVVHHSVEACAFLAGYRAAQRAETASRRSLEQAEAAIAEQVAHGGDAGETAVLDAAETEAAVGRLLAELGRGGRVRRAG